MRAARLAGIAAIVFALAACGGDGDEETQPPAPPPAATTEQATTTLGPVPEGEPPTTGTLAGTWTRFGEALLFRFSPEGAFAYDRSDPDSPFAAGTYEVKGTTIEFTAEGPGCADRWSWEAGIEEGEAEDPLDDQLHIVFAEPGCDVIAGTQWTFGRLAPE